MRGGANATPRPTFRTTHAAPLTRPSRILWFVQSLLASGVYWTTQRILDGLVNGAAWVVRKVGLGVDTVDRRAVDGAVNGVAFSTWRSGGLLKYIQSGNVQRYAIALFGGVMLLAIGITVFR